MNAKLQHRILGSVHKLASVTVRLVSRDQYTIHVLLLEKKGDQIKVTNRKSGIGSFEELQTFVPGTLPVVLTIEGWGVLVKKAEFDENGQILGSPVANPDEFELFALENNREGFISIIRNELFAEIVEKFEKTKLPLITVTAGPLSVIRILPLMPVADVLQAGNWQLIVENGQVAQVKSLANPESVEYRIGGEDITSDSLSGFSLAVLYLSGHYQEEPVNEVLQRDFAYKKLGVLAGWSVLSVLFLGLLVNYLVFDHLNKQMTLLNAEYSVNEMTFKRLKIAEEELKQKEDLMVKGGLNERTRYAWYLDRLVLLMPGEIKLTRLGIQPLEKKIMKGREIEFSNRQMIIEGETHESVNVYNWIETIKQEQWVGEVEMSTYTQDKDRKVASFTIELKF